ncbi:MAG: hypothetical protein WD294_02050 [Phycisphaeraceae bacterium]
MLKFFRQFVLNKAVMVVIASFLMILFLLPGVEMFMPQQGNQPIGEVNGKVLRVSDQRTAGAEMQTLARMGLGQSLPQNELTWLLLIEEARQNGIYASQAEIRGTIEDLQEAQMNPYAAAEAADLTEEMLFQALRHMLMVNELQEMIAGVRKPSEPRLAHFARDTGSTASADVVIIDAKHLFDAVEEPTEQEVQEQFEQYRDVRPGESEPFGFGYYLPPRVQMEYLVVPLSRVETGIEIDEVEARRFYMENPDLFQPRSSDELPEGHPEGEPMPYREVRPRVYETLLDRRAREKQDEIIRWIAGNFSQEERRLPMDRATAYRQIDEDTNLLSFEEIASRTQERYGVRPDVIRLEDRWLSPEDVDELEGFGDAYLEASNREYAVETYVFSVPEVDPSDQNPLLALRLQVGLASRPVQDDAGNRYLFRLLDADAPREPESLDEVHDEVVEDVKRLRAYRQLQEQQDELLQRALDEDLMTLAESFDTRVRNLDSFQGREGQTGRLQPPNLSGVGRSAAFVDSIFTTAQRAHEEAGSIEEAGDDLTTTVVPLDQQQAIAVARVRSYRPVNRQLYQMLRPSLPQQLASTDFFEMLTTENPFAPEAVKRRVGFIDARPDDEDADAAALAGN